jgi:CheY-like chemotaxis protein
VSDQTLVKVIVSMSHGLGMRVIAEGVETEAQCEIMRESVCDEIQGYLFSRPVDAQAMEVFLVSRIALPAHLLRLRKPQRTLMLVDDEPNILSSLQRLLRPLGHRILQAGSGKEGLALLEQQRVDIIISDQRMPEMTGVEFLSIAKERFPDTIRIILTGYAEIETVVNAINKGSVYRFLAKPWEESDLLETLRKALEIRDLRDENIQLHLQLHTANHELVTANRRLNQELATRA